MNGLQLYQKYTAIGQCAGRDSYQRAYADLLNDVFYLLGSTQLFDLLEEAEATNQCIKFINQPVNQVQQSPADAAGIYLSSREPDAPDPDTYYFNRWLTNIHF